MANRPRARRNDGVTITPGRSPGKSIVLLAAAVALACVALLVLFGGPPAPRPPARPAPAAAEHERVEAPPVPEAPAAPEAPAPHPAPRAPEPAAEAEPAAAEGPALPSGIGLFPPPGTDPVKIGIVVPDDYALPEGYLRHYQVTDDGQDLPPILLFHPDYEVKGPDGRPLPLPPDRVVPPELAPPGLPIEMLEVPEPLEEEGDLRLPFSGGAEDAADDER